MDFTWTEAQTALHDSMRALSVDVDETAGFSRENWRRCAEAGVLALPIPEKYGGLGLDPVTCAYALEGLGHGCADNGLLMSVGAHVWATEVPIWLFGSPEQQERYLPELCAGRMVGAHAITETEAGSDALSMASRARRVDDCYVLNGEKRFVTNGPIADVLIVYANVDPALGFTGVTAFLVERDQPGLVIEHDTPKAGLRTAPWARITMTDCEVPVSQRLGAEKQGRFVFSAAMAWERALILAPQLGAMRRQIDSCMDFARDRRQFGQRISGYQAVAHTIVDMRTRLETARLLTYRAAADLGTRSDSMFSEMAKLVTSEAAVQTYLDAFQVHGALGYTVDAGIDRALRDALGTRISSGTSAVQRNIIADKLGLRGKATGQ